MVRGAVRTAEMESPVGRIGLAVAGGKLVMLRVRPSWPDIHARLERRFGPAIFDPERDPGGVVSRLAEYFAGRLGALDEIPVDGGGTPFQARVWAELRRIPAGTTRTYSELARIVGRPGAVRAVGAANAGNHIAIVVPCHRVVGADGGLVGYGPGLPAKEWLLRHEGCQPDRLFVPPRLRTRPPAPPRSA